MMTSRFFRFIIVEIGMIVSVCFFIDWLMTAIFEFFSYFMFLIANFSYFLVDIDTCIYCFILCCLSTPY